APFIVPQAASTRETSTMLFHSWLRTLRSVLTRCATEGRQRRTPHRHPAARFRPRLEVLEDRLTPTTFYPVTVTADPYENGNRLNGAIAAANANPDPTGDGDVITLQAGDYKFDWGTVVGDGTLIITDPHLTIQGTGTIREVGPTNATVLEN